MAFPAEPWLEWRDVSLAGVARWADVDEQMSRWLGQPCLALPSVRVGLCWALESQGLRRHTSHVLVPRFVGRCILNSLSRVALPVEVPTAETRAAIVVDQYGLRQDYRALLPAFAARGWFFVEDSPYGIGDDERPADKSLGRFIGLGKVLPVAQGALLLTRDEELQSYVRRKREEWSAWSLPVWLTMARLRFRRQAGPYSEAADAAYEMYLAGRGGHRWLRGNMHKAFGQIHAFEAESRRRLTSIGERLGAAVLIPDLARLGYVVPFRVGGDEHGFVDIFRRAGFDASVYHVDAARNMLAPVFERCLLIPVNPRIPYARFDHLVTSLSERLAIASGVAR